MTFQLDKEHSYKHIMNIQLNKIMDLTCSYISSLPELPNYLEELIADDNENLVYLPASLPESLRVLSICLTGIKTLEPLILPQSLQELYISNNSGIQIGTLSPSLQIFSCNSCKLNQVDFFPDTLIQISISYNHITRIPAIPPNLKYLNIEHNQLTHMPKLPNTMHTLICSNNHIRTFVNIPNKLTIFHCQNNNIHQFPNIPLSLANSPFHKTNITKSPINKVFKLPFVYYGNPFLVLFNNSHNTFQVIRTINKINHFIKIYSSIKISNLWKKYRQKQKDHYDKYCDTIMCDYHIITHKKEISLSNNSDHDWELL